MQNIIDIANELHNLKNILGVATEHANQSADEIQLKSTKDFLSNAKIILNILKGRRTELDDNNTDLGRKVVVVFKGISNFGMVFPDFEQIGDRLIDLSPIFIDQSQSR